MSVARRRLMWLWAAVWLRWRLTRVKARHLFGGRAAAAGGLDYHLAPAEVPVEGVDYDPAELPVGLVAKLEATRAELLERTGDHAAPPRPRRARRRRVAVLATAALLGLGAVGGGAAALVTGSTGVPAVDRLLGIYEAELGESGRASGTGKDLQPGSSGASATVEVPVGPGRLVSTSYVAKDGRVCSVLADGERNLGDIVCVDGGSFATRLARGGGIVVGIEDKGDTIVLRGFVTGGATSLDGRGPSGPLDVHLGRTWTPAVSGVETVRPFVATGRSDVDGLIDPSDYVLRAIDDDGDSTDITP